MRVLGYYTKPQTTGRRMEGGRQWRAGGRQAGQAAGTPLRVRARGRLGRCGDRTGSPWQTWMLLVRLKHPVAQ